MLSAGPPCTDGRVGRVLNCEAYLGNGPHHGRPEATWCADPRCGFGTVRHSSDSMCHTAISMLTFFGAQTTPIWCAEKRNASHKPPLSTPRTATATRFGAPTRGKWIAQRITNRHVASTPRRGHVAFWVRPSTGAMWRVTTSRAPTRARCALGSPSYGRDASRHCVVRPALGQWCSD